MFTTCNSLNTNFSCGPETNDSEMQENKTSQHSHENMVILIKKLK